MGRNKRIEFGVCLYCGKQFEKRKPCGVLYLEKKYCGKSCSTTVTAKNRIQPTRTPEWNKKIGDAQRGEKANNWQGGIYPEQDAIRRRAEYKAWRTAVYERDDYTCVLCGQKGGELNADHIKSFAKHPELRLDISNGRTLCVSCHKKTPSYARNTRYQWD